MSRTLPLARWLLSTSVLASVIFLCAGHANSPMLMAYIAVFAGMGLVTALANDPSQDCERRKPGPAEMYANSRRGATALFLATVIIAALDAGRFRWSKLSGPTQILALAVLILAAGLQVWAMTANPFFSTAIQIQTKRGHQLITRGPYRFIRHPGYVAMIVFMPAAVVTLGSKLALIPAVCYSALILWRTKREDEFLVERLAEYAGYAARVGFRLIPGLW